MTGSMTMIDGYVDELKFHARGLLAVSGWFSQKQSELNLLFFPSMGKPCHTPVLFPVWLDL